MHALRSEERGSTWWGHTGCFWNADYVLFLDQGADYTGVFGL